jgi:pimeloyl-ACP methyl ester carboxylesterase
MAGRLGVLLGSMACLAALFACGSSPSPSHPATSVGAAPDGSIAPASTDDAGGSAPAQEGDETNGDDAGMDADAVNDSGGPRADVPAVLCNDTTGAVYVTPSGLAPMTMDQRGAIVACAMDTAFSVSDVTSKLAAKSVTGVVPTSGTTFYRIAYRTYRDDGVEGLSSARVYLPSTPRTLPLPVIAVGHPTEGLAPSCAPSMDLTDLDDLALPWAAHGFAVIATDYAGLGTAGVQGYTDNHDQTHSLLDSARALRALLDPRVFDDRVLLVGYSQGGGAVLASQGLAGTYGAGGTVVAGVVFAAEYYARNDSFGYETMLGEPTALTISTGISDPVVASSRDFAFAYNVLGPSNAAVSFPSSEQSGIQGAITTLCEVPFGGYLQGVAVHVGDIFDDTFRTSLLACEGSDAGGDAGCSGLASQFYTWSEADLVAPDPAGAPLLYLQGLSDTIMPPAREAACNVAELTNAGVDVQVCTDQPATHTDVVARNVAFALQWSEAKLAGAALPACSSSGMPACTP